MPSVKRAANFKIFTTLKKKLCQGAIFKNNFFVCRKINCKFNSCSCWSYLSVGRKEIKETYNLIATLNLVQRLPSSVNISNVFFYRSRRIILERKDCFYLFTSCAWFTDNSVPKIRKWNYPSCDNLVQVEVCACQCFDKYTVIDILCYW